MRPSVFNEVLELLEDTRAARSELPFNQKRDQPIRATQHEGGVGADEGPLIVDAQDIPAIGRPRDEGRHALLERLVLERHVVAVEADQPFPYGPRLDWPKSCDRAGTDGSDIRRPAAHGPGRSD